MSIVTTRKQLIELLEGNVDLEYKKFQIRIGIPENNLLGVRMPILKKIAKDISKSNYQDYLKFNQNITYEEKIIYGLVISKLPISFDEVLLLLDDFLPHIDSWAVCDTLMSSLKIWKDNLDLGYKYLEKQLKKDNVWCNRFFFVMLLRYYINDEYIDKIIDVCSCYRNSEYYVKMAIAWLLAECYYYYPVKIKKLLEENKLDIWVHNKTIQKIKESNKIKKDIDINYLRR